MTRADAVLRWGGAGVIVWSALLRAWCAASRVPWWDTDPTQAWLPENTLTPGERLVLDALVLLAASAVVLGESLAGRRVAWKTGLLLAGGALVAGLHGWILTPLVAVGAALPVTRGDGASLSLGASWTASLAGAWALAQAGRDPRLRRWAVISLLGAASVWAARGVHQVLVEHPRMVRHFESSPEAVLASRGWAPGTATAALFERRLRQPEAIGWFGLANVYGSVMAACLAGWTAIAISGVRAARARAISSGEGGLLVLMAIASLTGLALSGSKGAIVAGAIGVALVLLTPRVLAFASRRVGRAPSQLGAALALVLLGAVMLGLTVRGMLGERLGELSLLFRWQYAVAAVRITLEHVPWGVGPAGFKDAYLFAKVPLNPEEVESPHMVLLDWTATLGIGGVCWAIVLLGWAIGAGRGLASSVEPARGVPESERRAPVHAAQRLWIPGLAAVATAVVVGWGPGGAEMALVLSVGTLAAWYAMGAGIGVCAWRDPGHTLTDSPRSLSPAPMDPSALGASAAALVLLVHGLIEVTLVQAPSAPWALALIALGAAACHGATAHAARADASPPAPRQRAQGAAIAAGLCAALALACAGSGVRQIQGQALLASASRDAADLGEVTRALSAALQPDSPRMSSEQWNALLEHAQASAARSILSLEAASRRSGRPEPLTMAAGIEIAMARSVWLAAQEFLVAHSNESAHRWFARAIDRLDRLARRTPRSSAAWGRLGGACDAGVNWATSDPIALARRGAEAWERAAELDPWSVVAPLRAARLWDVAREPAQAARAARLALANNIWLRLDPIKALTDRDRAFLEGLVARDASDSVSGAADPARPAVPKP